MGLCQQSESLENQVKMIFFTKKEPLMIARTVKNSSIMLRRKKNRNRKVVMLY